MAEGVKAPSLRAHLLALVLAILLPALGLGAATAWHMAGNYRAVFEERLSDTARALALALDREVQAHAAALAALAASPRLDPGEDGGFADLSGFYVHAQGAAEALGSPIVVVGADLRQRLHTDRPFGAPLPPTGAAEATRTVFETARPVTSDLIIAAVLQKPAIAVLVPILREGRVLASLNTSISTERLSRLLALQGLSGGAFALLTDGRGVITARSSDAERFIGRRAPEWLALGATERQAGILTGRSLAGHRVILAYHRSASGTGWTVAVAEPLAAYRLSWLRPLAALAAGGAATLLIALAAAVGLGRRILRPVRMLTRRAEATVEDGGEAPHAGEAGHDDPAGVAEFERLRLSMRRAEAALRERAAEVAAGEARLRAVVDTAADAIVVIDEAGVIRSFNHAAEAIFGYSADEVIGWNVSVLMGTEHARWHDGRAADHQRSGERRGIGLRQEIEGRRKGGSAVPLDLAVAAWRDADGRRYFTGIMRDVSARKAQEARRVLLMREVDHRAKNALAVVQSVLRLTPANEPRAFAAAVEARVAAIARAHALLAEEGWAGADLRALLERELAPYMAPRAGAPGGGTIWLDGPPVTLASTAVQPLAMVLHELATNVAKHGGLSRPGGAVAVRWQVEDRPGADEVLRLRWAEAGGPPITTDGAAPRQGFGMRVVDATIRGQLGGAVERRWEPSGLVVEIALPLARVLAGWNEVGGTTSTSSAA